MRGRIQRNCRGARASGCDGARQQGPLWSACADAGEGRGEEREVGGKVQGHLGSRILGHSLHQQMHGNEALEHRVWWSKCTEQCRREQMPSQVKTGGRVGGKAIRGHHISTTSAAFWRIILPCGMSSSTVKAYNKLKTWWIVTLKTGSSCWGNRPHTREEKKMKEEEHGQGQPRSRRHSSGI